MYDCVMSSSSIIPHLGWFSSSSIGFAYSYAAPPSPQKSISIMVKRNNCGALRSTTNNNNNNPNPLLFKEEEDDDDDDDDVGKLLLSIIHGGGEEEDLEVVKMKKKKSRMKMMNRSKMMAKQVISVESALTLGFLSQLWLDVTSWLVKVVEVKPNLLSGELEKFLLQDIIQVGDVILVKDESVVDNEFNLVGLETLVGYNVVTPARRKIGKVRGYSFNVDSGAVEFLELDSFGISIIPSSLVSTYALFIEDVLEVGSDTVVVHEAAASRIQRLTKGVWDTRRRVSNSVDEYDEYPEPRKEEAKSNSRVRRKRNLSSRRRPRPEMADDVDEWELPMDYL